MQWGRRGGAGQQRAAFCKQRLLDLKSLYWVYFSKISLFHFLRLPVCLVVLQSFMEADQCSDLVDGLWSQSET